MAITLAWNSHRGLMSCIKVYKTRTFTRSVSCRVLFVVSVGSIVGSSFRHSYKRSASVDRGYNLQRSVLLLCSNSF
jgi:hypothetical protein